MWSVHKRTGREAGRGGPSRAQGNDDGWETVRDRWTGPQTQSLRSGKQQVGKSIRNPVTHARAARGTWNQCNAAGAEYVRLLSKWSYLCLKVDCRLVLSLETGALISVWLCWLSFSSISTVQQEKPCGHTFNGAPAGKTTAMPFSEKLKTREKYLQSKSAWNTLWL